MTGPVKLIGISSPDRHLPEVWMVKGHLYKTSRNTLSLHIFRATSSLRVNYVPEYSAWWDRVGPQARIALQVQDRLAYGLRVPKALIDRYAKLKGRIEVASRIRHSRHIPQWVKIHVVIRDRGCCVKCGCNDSRLLEFDHLIPFSLGGPSDDPDNIRLLCIACNRSKGAGMEVGV
jgi:5-methylcytosine-specific restriction endonuclease McrA